MNYTVAIEDNLTNVNQELDTKYSLVKLKEADLDNVDAVILNGKDENVMDMMNTITEVPVINAEGLNASQVESALNQKLNHYRS